MLLSFYRKIIFYCIETASFDVWKYFIQAKKVQSTVLNGVRRALSSVWFMASCLQRLPSSI